MGWSSAIRAGNGVGIGAGSGEGTLSRAATATPLAPRREHRRRIVFTVGTWRVSYRGRRRAGGEQNPILAGTLAGSPIFDTVTGAAWVPVVADGDSGSQPEWASLDDIVEVL